MIQGTSLVGFCGDSPVGSSEQNAWRVVSADKCERIAVAHAAPSPPALVHVFCCNIINLHSVRTHAFKILRHRTGPGSALPGSAGPLFSFKMRKIRWCRWG